jgi:hypothetical protein
MAVTGTRMPDPRGEAMAAELKWVHDLIRRDLRTVSVDLLAHLQYEEAHISGTLRTWSGWPLR